MSPLDVFSEPVWQRLTWTLLHFLWQGLAVAALLVTVFWLFRVRQARIRYAVSLAAMLVMVACPLVTFAVMEVGAERDAEVAEVGQDAAERSPIVAPRDVALRAGPQAGGEVVVSPPPVEPHEEVVLHDPQVVDRPAAAQATEPRATLRLLEYTRTVQPYLMLGWIAGVSLLGGRLLLAQVGVQWLRRRRRPISAELLSCVARLRKRLGLRSVPRVFGCERIGEAIVVGLLRPMVLLPACWLVEMTPEVLEAVIAHELAHIRRWDLWVNLFQRLVETLLFYQPAVWWVSRRVRLEREMCCDELAIAATGQWMAYATALSQAACKQAARTKPLLGAAMGGTEMTLLNRVRYVLGLAPGRERARWWPVGLLALLVPLGVWFGSIGTGLTGEGERQVQERPLAGPKKGSPKGEFSANLQQSARLAVTLELTALHWRSLESEERSRPLVTSVIDGLQKGQGGNPWKVSFFPLNPPGPERAQLDQFEVKALREIRAGKAEVWHQAANGETRYVRAIRATEKSCVICHTSMGTGATDAIEEDDILGVASLRLAAGKENVPEKRKPFEKLGLPVPPGSPEARAEGKDVPTATAAGEPYRVRPFDLLTIKALGTIPDRPIDRVYLVEPSGRVALGPVYGRAQLKGLTLEEAESAIEKHLRQVLREPKVQVTTAGRVTRWRRAVLPKAPYRIRPNDSVGIRVAGTLPDHPIDGPYAIEPSGQVPLGPKYGRARLGGLTLEEAEEALDAHLDKWLLDPKAYVTMEGWKSDWRDSKVPGPSYRIRMAPGELLDIQVMGTLANEPIRGIHLVEPSGKVALGPSYGRVRIEGLTVQEAQTAIEEHLKKVLRDPHVSVSPAGWRGEEEPSKRPGVRPDEQDAVAALTKRGARVERDATGMVKTVSFSNTRATDADLLHLKGLTNLRRLDLHSHSEGYAGFNRVYLTGAGLAHLGGLAKLEELNLLGTTDTDAGLAHLNRLTKLKSLDLGYTKVTDAGLAHLGKLTGLESLSLEAAHEITDAGLSHLKGLAKLERLRLNYTTIGDAGLKHLKPLAGLRSLHLYGAKVTDAGVEYLAEMNAVRDLHIRRTQITAAGLKKLHQALPNTKIFADGGVFADSGWIMPVPTKEGEPGSGPAAAGKTDDTDAVTALRQLGAHIKLDDEGRVSVISMNGAKMTDAKLAALEGLSHLRSLSLAWSDLTDAGLVHLRELTDLEDLNLVSTKVTDAGLVHLKGMRKLQKLVMGRTPLRGDGLKHLSGLSNLRSLDFSQTQVSDVGLASLGKLANLEELTLSFAPVTDAGLAHLKGLTKLRLLELRGTKTTGAGLVHLERMTKLQRLDCRFTPIDDRGLKSVGRLSDLESLDLGRARITDAGLAHLKGLTKLESLQLDGTTITNAGLADLKGLTNLVSLGLSGTKMTDAGLVYLRAYGNLRSLGLHSTAISDAALEHLQTLPKLETLVFDPSRGPGTVTRAGIEKLQQALPNLRVVSPVKH